ncbi:DUF2029 domain-containing protein [Luteolibacter arcticus]|uniref:DUF2029 domain-containing protein n=1 Tax=Luteolibacter arcticus TaxID=1581411 RepID=A0ABT3GSG7_9BACT|nr:glycosyltransferase family 87 protein [Luteolibacter arcticus]MCW1926473.1 DUF2029 domain-containing protein [Luteolibacter arcticus]
MNDTPTDKATPRPRGRVLAAVFFVMAAALVTAYWLLALAKPASSLRIDLQPTYLAGRLWSEGHYEAIYHPSVFVNEKTADPAWVEMARKTEQRSKLREGSFVYSPWYLMLVAPLTKVMSVERFTEFWFALNILSAVWIGWEAMAWAGRPAAWLRAIGAVLAGLTLPMIYGASLGQNVGPCLALVMLGVRFAHGGKGMQVSSGLLFTLAALFKPWAILLTPLLGLSRRWTPFVTAVSASLLLMAGSHSPLLPQATRDDYKGMNESLVNMTNVAFNNVSVRSFLERMADPKWGGGIRTWTSRTVDPQIRWEALLIAAAVAALAAWPLWKNRGDLRRVVAGGLPLVLVPLGICWTHYLVLLIPAMWMLMFGSKSIIPRVVGWGIFGVFITMPFYDPPVAFHLFERAPMADTIALQPQLWAWWYLLPLVLGIGLAFTLLLAGRGSKRPCNERSSSP